MPIIIRDDGTPFVYYTTRESILEKKPALMKQEIRELQAENGNYARFFVQMTGDVEAVFSTEPGYLLAESIWDYFNQPQDMIFCEELPDGEKAILVVVRDGRVYFDAIMPIVNLVDEFIVLSSERMQYQIYMYGDHLPLAEVPSDEKFAFNHEMVKSFIELEDPIFVQLEVDPALKLLPFAQALKDLPFAKSAAPQVIVAIIILAVLGYGAYQLLKPVPATTPLPSVKIVPIKVMPTDPFAQYKHIMDTPSVSDLLLTFVSHLKELYTIPGWQPSNVNYNTQVMNVTLVPVGGTASSLVLWLKKNDMIVTTTAANASLKIDTKVPNRAPPTQIYNLRDSVVEVFNRMKFILSDKGVQLGATTKMGNFAQTSLTLNVSDVSPDTLLIISRTLQDLPIIMTGCTFNIRDGLLAGTIKIQVVGEQK